MSFAVIVHSALRNAVLAQMEENGIQARPAGANAILVPTIATQIDVGFTFFPLSPPEQEACTAACLLKSVDAVKMMLGVAQLATLPFDGQGELDDGEAQSTCILHHGAPTQLMYNLVAGPELRQSIGGPLKGGVWCLFRATRSTAESYTILDLGLDDSELVEMAQRLIDKADY